MSEVETFKGRREDPRFLAGLGRYTNDWNLPGQVHAGFCRADRARAAIKNVDVSAAQAAPSVLMG